MSRVYLTLVLLTFLNLSFAQNSYTLSGYVKDAESGETLVAANVFNLADPTSGTTTNTYGFYSLSLPEGKYQISYSYLGYATQELEVDLSENRRLNIDLSEGITIEEVVITAKQEDHNVQSTEMGTVELPVEQIKTLPSFLGEVDILKALQLLPGVLSAAEGTAGFYVRGGGPDQNLVLLDEAVVYNSGHMLGFFSVFNSDAIKDTRLIKGGMPAYYGGRLSSVVDVQMKEGNNKTFGLEGGIGLVASRFTLQGPIQREKSSFILSARRTYVFDLAQPVLKETDYNGTNYYFYDLNAKANYRFSDKDRLYLSAYFGRDILKFKSDFRGFYFDMPYGNSTLTLRWNHLFSDRLFMNTSLIYNDYDFSFNGGQDNFTVKLFSGVRDYNARVDFDYFPNYRHQLKFGLNYTWHRLTPNIASASAGEIEFNTNLKSKYAHDAALYIQDDYKMSKALSFNLGLRATYFALAGPYTSPISGKEYGALEVVKPFWGVEPRISMKYQLSKSSSFKAGITYTRQYLHLVSNSTTTLPTDVWVPSSEKVDPQRGVQYAIGYFRNFKNNVYEGSVELYYRNLKNQIDYGESYINDPATEVEESFVFGKGRSYGAEFFLKKNSGRLNGWLGYTLSRTERSFPDIQNGETYPARYDRTHDISAVMNYQLNKRWAFGAVFVYGTGIAFTPIKSLFLIERELNVEYGDRNSARLQDYHRLDLSATLTPAKSQKKHFKSSWNFSIYNVYSRFNPLFTYYYTDLNEDTGRAEASASKLSLFPIIPSITWNFKWNQQKEEPAKLIND